MSSKWTEFLFVCFWKYGKMNHFFPMSGISGKETVASRRESTSDFYGSVEDYAFVSADDMDERRKVRF